MFIKSSFPQRQIKSCRQILKISNITKIMAECIKKEIWGTWEKRKVCLFAVFIFAIIVVCALYFFCVSAIVMEAANREHFSQDFKAVQKEHQELEKNYLSLLSRLNLDYAYSLGFINEESTAFIVRKTAVAQNNGYGQLFGGF